jgi:iron complex outermembrane receptor protein
VSREIGSKGSGFIVVFFFFITLKTVFPQSGSDTVRLKEVEIKAGFQIDNRGFKRVKMDSTILIPRMEMSLGTLLSQYSTIFIKSYGASNLATPSFRGTTAHHTQVEWNGININSPMLGQIDLSLVPVSQFEGVEILYGAAGITRTSGAFGGIVNLASGPDWLNKTKVTLSQTLASFQNFTTALSVSLGNTNFQSLTKMNLGSGKNDFPFFNDYADSVMRQANAGNLQIGFSEDAFIKIRNRHLITGRLWYSSSRREIPPLNTNPDPGHDENQEDRSWKGVLEYKYVEKAFNFTIRSAFVNDFLHYRYNGLVDAKHRYSSSINQFRLAFSGFRRWTINPGVDYTYSWVNSDAYAGQKRRTVLAGFTEVIFIPSKKLSLSCIAREEVVDGLLMPFIPALGVEYRPWPNPNISFSGNISRNYRYPSLNDLYWETWGNPDLLPEISYSAEGDITWNWLSNDKTFFMEIEITGYYILLKDMIVWTPSSSGSSVWIPENISEVLSRGLEFGINASILLGKTSLDLNGTYNYCRSTYEKQLTPDDASLGKQLIYTPVNTANTSLRISRKNFYFSYIFNYIGRRYTGKDNLTYMPGYNLSNIFFGKNIHMNKFVLSLQLEINNLFDLDYQSVVNRPMPGRNFALTIRGNFTDKSNK